MMPIMRPEDLTSARNRTGMMQAEFAACIGYSRANLIRMETGRAAIPYQTTLLVRAIGILGADPGKWPDQAAGQEGGAA